MTIMTIISLGYELGWYLFSSPGIRELHCIASTGGTNHAVAVEMSNTQCRPITHV